MPYINVGMRAVINRRIADLLVIVRDLAAGEVNYLFTMLLRAWVGDVPTYGRLNEAIGVLECAKLELYRRMAAPYEDGKRAANGDVYPNEIVIRDRASRKEPTQ